MKECVSFFFACRYTGAGAAVDSGYQQEDDRGSESFIRVMGKGTIAPQHHQR